MKKGLALATLATSLHAVTLIGAGGIGEEVDQYNAARRSLGNSGMAMTDQGTYSYHNPARMAFGDKTSFGATLSGEALKSERGSIITNDNGFGFPAFSLVFSATDFAFSMAYLQTYQNDIRIKDAEENKIYESLGGLSEIVLSGSYRFINQLGVGLAYHLVSGKDRRYVKFDSSPELWGFDSESPVFEPYMEQEMVNSGSYPSMSVHWEDKYWALSAGYKFPYEVERSVESEVYARYSSEWANGIRDAVELNIYSLETNRRTFTQKFPGVLALGGRYNLTRLNLLTFDFLFSDASDEDYAYQAISNLYEASAVEHQMRWSLGAGYQWGASSKPFDDYYKKMAFRAGLGLKSLYQGEGMEWRSTLGLGLPLGNRGATVDVGVHYGNRFGEGNADFEEQFAGFSLTFTGFGNWGEPSRRYR